jgi:hypothetical protein
MDKTGRIAARMVFAASIREGDVCAVDMADVRDVWPQQLGIIRDVVRQGRGKVVVEEVWGDVAQVSAHYNPTSRMVGMVDVPLSALSKVASRAAGRSSPGKYAVVSEIIDEIVLMERALEDRIDAEQEAVGDGAEYNYAPWFRKLRDALRAAQKVALDVRRMTE